MRFKNFLIESNENDKDFKLIVDNVNSSYLDLITSSEGTLIYRGMNKKNSSGVTLMTPKAGRKSANTSNEFTTLVDNFLPSWKDYPKRSNSFICSTDMSYAAGFGYLHMVLPVGITKIGVCPENDMWSSFNFDQDNSDAIPFVNHLLHNIAAILNDETGKEYNFQSNNLESELEKIINDVDEAIKDKSIDKIISNIDYVDDADDDDNNDYRNNLTRTTVEILEMAKSKKSLVKALDDFLNTETNGFKLLTPEKIFKDVNHNHEVWFSTPAIFILPLHNEPLEFLNKLKQFRK